MDACCSNQQLSGWLNLADILCPHFKKSFPWATAGGDRAENGVSFAIGPRAWSVRVALSSGKRYSYCLGKHYSGTSLWINPAGIDLCEKFIVVNLMTKSGWKFKLTPVGVLLCLHHTLQTFNFHCRDRYAGIWTWCTAPVQQYFPLPKKQKALPATNHMVG